MLDGSLVDDQELLNSVVSGSCMVSVCLLACGFGCGAGCGATGGAGFLVAAEGFSGGEVAASLFGVS